MLSGISRVHRVRFGLLLLLAMLGVIVFWFHESRMHLIQESAARVPDRMIASKAADLVRHPAGQVRAPNKSEDPNASRVPTEQVGSEIDSRTIESCHGALVSLKYLNARTSGRVGRNQTSSESARWIMGTSIEFSAALYGMARKGSGDSDSGQRIGLIGSLTASV